jgi:hypothetical protein
MAYCRFARKPAPTIRPTMANPATIVPGSGIGEIDEISPP